MLEKEVTERHRPVMPEEVLALLAPERGGLIVDATLGMGGHTELILGSAPAVQVLGLDRDAESIRLAEDRLARFGDRFKAVQSDYREIASVVAERGLESVDGILVDLGISSYQLDNPERGFSFRGGEAALDMRMDRSQGETAADLINRLAEGELADLIFEYGEERASRRIARRIIQEREVAPIGTTAQLAELVIRAVNQPGHWKIHPATKTFQALRIAVNQELDGLGDFVTAAVELLKPEGRLVIITFHSLEDRMIKQALRLEAGQCKCPPRQMLCVCGARRKIEVLTRKALVPSEEEVKRNPRARSAKLRACRRLDG